MILWRIILTLKKKIKIMWMIWKKEKKMNKKKKKMRKIKKKKIKIIIKMKEKI